LHFLAVEKTAADIQRGHGSTPEFEREKTLPPPFRNSKAATKKAGARSASLSRNHTLREASPAQPGGALRGA
jgi:hypothetical protein